MSTQLNQPAMVTAHLKAARSIHRKVVKDPKEARRMLVEAGILTKDGKRLARRYR